MLDGISKVWSALVSLVIAILSGLGVGSGGLLMIWLTVFEGLGVDSARGLNLLFFVFSASAALVFHLLRRRLNLRMVAVLAVFACVGTLVGTYVGAVINPVLVRRIFGGMLIFSGSYTLISRLRGAGRKRDVTLSQK